MSTERLKTLVIRNFRSLRGEVVVPLDAQVVLVHGTNGMGKTSVLSALELALTGKIAHLAADGDGYRSYLTTLETGGGSIELTTTGPLREGARTKGTLDFSDTTFKPTPLLDAAEARFFAERCYLPQATLGKLLELYDDRGTGSTSPLTQFVKELLGLDPLDALVDGLFPAFNVTRIRNLVPAYRRLESLRTSLVQERDRISQSIRTTEQSRDTRASALTVTLAGLAMPNPITVDPATDIEALRTQLESERSEERALADLGGARSHITGLRERWRSLPTADADHDRAASERVEAIAAEALRMWRTGVGKELGELIATLRIQFSDIPEMDDGPEEARAFASRRAEAESARADSLVKTSNAAAEKVKALNTTVQRATARIGELNDALASGAKDARSLASALAGVAPHVEGDICPVCNRNFAEQDAGSLSAHIAAKIASLTSEAGRLQALSTERAEESTRLAAAQRDLLSATSGQLGAEEQADLTVRALQMADAAQRLKQMVPIAEQGRRLTTEARNARDAVAAARRLNEMSRSLVPEIEQIVQSVTGTPASNFETIDEALAGAERLVNERNRAAEAVLAARVRALSELDLYAKDRAQIEVLKGELEATKKRLAAVERAAVEVDTDREYAKKVSGAAGRVRAGIVKKVFNTSLNKVWRDLFVRLAPSEQFVPQFQLPTEDDGKVEAVLETLHRSGKTSGTPGAMLSQGNLNTAALTLFLALHLSVPSRFPWLVLDDPIQSMDDVHIAQFAALLRTLAKGMGRQLIVAVHERALFDYLSLELSPSFPGDSLIAVEITRNFDGNVVATPASFAYHEDHLVAA
ncbi:chromosome segregation protein [Bordetella ansorpii]|uniref:Chromosome segregation protein n=1 Tax=Bordetella ansorpii TaxID=288768 RepID=A0A157S5J2_9BORD|nr:AAA family ATPase [Bordetella ansorpii]SAI65561.1 chromosome segregation protein [Bordetella ansorpii]